MKHINHKTVFVSLLAFFLLVSFTPPLKKTKKVEEKPIATFLPMGGGIIKPVTSQTISLVSGNVNTTVSNSSVIQNIQNGSAIDSVARLSTENGMRLNEIIQPITPLPVKPLSLDSKSGLFKLAEKLKSNTNEELASTQREYYKYDSTSKVFEKIVTPSRSVEAVGFDPVRFTLSSNKDSVSIGEEIEIKITADYLDVSPSLMFQFEGSNAFTLKMLLPEGFIQTGGTYYDYIQGKVDKENPKQEFIIKGVFETQDKEPCFSLLRSFAGAGVNDVWERKYTYCNTFFQSVKNSLNPNYFGTKSMRPSDCNTCTTDGTNNVDCNNVNKKWCVSTVGYAPFKTLYCNEDEEITFSTQVFNYTGSQKTFYAYVHLNESKVNIPKSGCFQTVQLLKANMGADATTDYYKLVTLNPDANTFISVKYKIKDLKSPPNGTYHFDFVSEDNIIGFDKKICSLSNASASFNIGTINSPTVTATPATISQGQSSSLSASGCPSGSSVEWDNSLGAGSTKTFPPTGQSYAIGTYTIKAKCVSSTGCESAWSNGATVNINCPSFNTPTISPANPQIAPEGSVTLNTSCNNGIPTWKVNGRGAIEGNSLTITSQTSDTYTVRCIVSTSCYSDESNPVRISVKQAPTLSTTKTTLCNTEKAVLSTNCPSGSIIAYYKKNGTVWENFTTPSETPAGTYSAKCNSTDGDPLRSNEITITPSGSTPPAPTITADKTTICGAESTTLTATNCTASNIKWSNNETGSLSIVVNTTGSYTATCSATCGTSTVTSSPSNSIAVTYSAICDCSTAVISANAPGNRINEHSTLILSVPVIPGATYYWSGPNIPNGTILTQSTLTIPNVSLANAGLYDVTMNCSAKKFITIGVDDIDECAGNFDYIAYSLSPNGEVGVGDELRFIADGGSGATYEWTGPAGFYSLEQFPKITLATKANEGGYNVIITKTINGNTCSVNAGMVVKIGECNFEAGPSFTETNSSFNLSVWSNKDLVGATFEWLKQQSDGSWQTVALYGNPSFEKNYTTRGTYKLKVSYKGCYVEKDIKVNFIAPPSYQGYMGSATCEGITVWLQDNNNLDFSLNHTFRYKIDNNEWLYTFRNNEGQVYQHFTIPIPQQYKDGLPHTVIAYYPNSNTPFINSTNRTFQCCSGFVFDKTPIVTCTSASVGSLTVTVKRENLLMDRPIQYFIESQSKNEDGQNIYKNYSSNWETADSKGEYTFVGLPNGNYRIRAKELTPLDNGCLITTNAAVNCQGAGCVAPLVTIFPDDNFREGMGIVPKLYANAAANPSAQPANAQGGLKLNGKGSASMPNYNWMKSNFSIEATIFPSPEGNISVGDASDGSMQRYLFTSWTGGVGTGNAAFYLSVGSNGINVIESGDNLRRVAISYDGSLTGWTHIAVVYKNNVATLFVNGQAVGKSTVTPNNYNVVGPNSIGTDQDKGFIGNIYATRLWASSLESQVVAQLKNNLDPVLATEPNVGFWIFDKQPVAGNVEDLSTHKRKIKLEGEAYVSIVEAPILAPNAPVFEWWLNGIKVGTGNTYTPPLNKTVAGTYNYVVKYQQPNGSYCQTTKPLTITPAIYGSLSGCYTILANGDQRPIYPKYTPNDGQYTIMKGYGASEKEIWRFEHLGNEIYRINSAFFTDMALAAPNSLPLGLRDKRVNNSDQKWKANLYDAATLTYTFTPQNATNKRLGYFWGDTDPLIARPMSGADGILEAFQLVPAACPLPAQECNASGLATIERWLQPALLGTNPNNNNVNWSTLNAGQYIKDNPNRYSTNFPLANFNITNSTSNNYLNKPGSWPDGRWVQRITGYLCAPKNGDYTFFIKTDEWAQLWMSTDEDPRNKRLVAQCTEYAGGFDERGWEQRGTVTLSKGRSYYFEVVMKDEINSMNVSVAWVRPDEFIPSSNWNNLQPMPMTYISAVPRDVTPRQLIVVADKTKAAPTENVTLTASGCDYGRVVWKAGTEVIQDPNASITTITRQGPGIYQAMCTGDYNVVQDWVTVKVDITTEVLPIIPAIPPVCANGSVNLSISNPQAGLSVRWLWLKDDQASIDTYNQFNSSGNIFVTHPSIFNSVDAATTTQTGPRTYWVQFYNGSGYKTLPKPVVVAPYFVENIKATNNGPIESGGTLTLSAGELAGASYAWLGPDTETPRFTSALRSPTRANFDASMAGTYSLTIQAPPSAGSCLQPFSTVVDMANCDIYIKAINPAAANAETYQLPRKPNGAVGFDPLILKVLPLEGTANFSAYDVTWMLNGNPIPTGTAGISWVSGAEPTLTTNQIGEYVAVLSLKRNPATTCEARVNLNAIPCRTFNANLNCTLPVITAASQLGTGIPLAVGDVFTAGDYKVTITEITSGSQTGYNGKGYVEQMKLIGLPVAKQVAVMLENTVVNDCYELAGGKVISEYDPNWGGVLDVDVSLSSINSIYRDISDLLNNYTCSNENKRQLQTYISQLIDEKGKINNSDVSDELKTQLNSTLTNDSQALTCLVNSCSLSGESQINFRSSNTSCEISTVLSQINNSEQTVIAPAIVWAIRMGGQCLTAAAIDIAVQYVLEGALLVIDNKATSLSNFSIIWPNVSYLQAGGSCVESFFKCKPCSAVVNGVTSITSSLLTEYEKHGEDVKAYNWAGIGTTAFIDVAASYIGNVAGESLGEYFVKLKGKIIQRGYFDVKKSLKLFLPDNFVNLLMEKASGLLTSSGTFADAILETNYQRYLARKGSSAKNRLDWMEAVEYFFGKTTIGRGNTFNTFRRSAFPYNEITLINGKRVDSYIPNVEIVSRKATDLNEIELNTFKSYLSEMKLKYSSGTEINATTVKNNPGIGNKLSGRLVLEIPNTNSTFSNLQSYINLARTYGIDIRLAPES